MAPSQLPAGVALCRCGSHGKRGEREGYDCGHAPAVKVARPVIAVDARVAKTPWSRAVATTCERGHNHPSKVEARVCAVVYGSVGPGDGCVFRNVRLPLWTLAPSDTGCPLYINVDFAVIVQGRIRRLIDAKSGVRRSRDWLRGRKAAEATYGMPVEEVEA